MLLYPEIQTAPPTRWLDFKLPVGWAFLAHGGQGRLSLGYQTHPRRLLLSVIRPCFSSKQINFPYEIPFK